MKASDLVDADGAHARGEPAGELVLLEHRLASCSPAQRLGIVRRRRSVRRDLLGQHQADVDTGQLRPVWREGRLRGMQVLSPRAWHAPAEWCLEETLRSLAGGKIYENEPRDVHSLLPGVTALDLTSSRCNSDCLQVFVGEAPEVAGLTRLVLDDNDIDDERLLALLGQLPSLLTLSLVDTSITDRLLPALAAHPSLRSLDLRQNDLSGADLSTSLAVLTSVAFSMPAPFPWLGPVLQHLHVDDTFQADGKRLSHWMGGLHTRHPQLRSLRIDDLPASSSLSRCQILPRLTELHIDVLPLDGLPPLPHLRSLRLTGGALSMSYVEALLQRAPGLRSLGLPRAALPDELGPVLAQLPLQELDLTDNRLTVAGLRALADLPLRELRLEGNPVGDAGVVWLAAQPGLAALHTLDLVETGFGVTGLGALSRSPMLVDLQTLRLRRWGTCLDHLPDDWQPLITDSPAFSAQLKASFTRQDLVPQLDLDSDEIPF